MSSAKNRFFFSFFIHNYLKISSVGKVGGRGTARYNIIIIMAIVRVKRTRKSIDDSLKVLNLQEEENHIMASWMPLMASLTAAVNETLTAASTRTCDVV